MKLGELISLARELKGMTLRDVEAKSGVSNALISQIETGKVKDPGIGTIVRIADALGLSIDRVADAVRPFNDITILRGSAFAGNEECSFCGRSHSPGIDLCPLGQKPKTFNVLVYKHSARGKRFVPSYVMDVKDGQYLDHPERYAPATLTLTPPPKPKKEGR